MLHKAYHQAHHFLRLSQFCSHYFTICCNFKTDRGIIVVKMHNYFYFTINSKINCKILGSNKKSGNEGAMYITFCTGFLITM